MLPYKAISQSGVLLSALSQARVVAASAIGDMTALVNATQEGYCIPPEDPPALAIALRAILARNPADLRTAGTAARDRLSDTFGWTRIAESTITQYQRCLRPRSARVALQLPGRQPAS